MSVVEPGEGAKNIVDRVKSILLQPKATWDVIDVEPATIAGIYKSYFIPLALIPAVCGLIGAVVFGYGAFGFSYKPPIVAAVASAVVQFCISLAMVYVLALIIDALAPTFGGQKSKIQAFKVAAYSMTASCVAGIFSIFPPLAVLGILGLYGFYLLYVGLPKLMKTTEDKALPYTALTIVAAVVMAILAGMVSTAVAGAAGAGRNFGLSDRGAATGTVNIPGGASVDLGKLEASAKQMEAAAKQMEAGANGEGVQPTDPEILKAMLPGSVQGYSRTEVSSASGGAAGMSGSTAEGVYTKGDARFTLTITDMAAAGALAGMASAFNVQSSSESNGRYEKVGRVDGRMTTESYDKTSGHGEYGVMVGDRFMVQADGQAPIGDLKSAVSSVSPGRLEQLAKKG